MIKNVHFVFISTFFLLILALFLLFNPDSYPIDVLPDTDTVVMRNAEPPREVQHAEIAIVTGGTQSAMVRNITSTISFLRHDYIVCDSVSQATDAEVIICASSKVSDGELAQLKEFLTAGGAVIFAAIPDPATEEVLALLEIASYQPNYRVAGFDLYEGVLLGGLFRANEFGFPCAKVTLTGRCRVFANGHDPSRDPAEWVIDLDQLNPILWRTYHGDGTLFVLNAPLLDEFSGSGILTGILSLLYEDYIYPIVGTKSVVLDNFPYLTTDELQISGRTSYVFSRDIIWPDLFAIAKQMNFTYTCLLNRGFSSSRDAYDAMGYFNNELYKTTRGELGYSAGEPSDDEVSQRDMQYLSTYFPLKLFRSIKARESGGALTSDMTALIQPTWDDALTWVSDTAITLPVATSGTGDEQTDYDFMCLLSSLGLVVHEVDLLPAFSGELAWNEYSVDISTYFSAFFNRCDFLRPASVRNAAEAAKGYLNLDLSVSHAEKSLSGSITNFNGEAAFLLRTEKTIDVQGNIGCTTEEIEDGAYLVTASAAAFSIRFE